MLDIDDRLRVTAQNWQHAVDAGAQPSTEPVVVRAPGRPRARILAPAFSILVVLIVAGGVVVASRRDTGGSTAAAPSPSRPVAYSGVTFHLPLTWKVSTPYFSKLRVVRTDDTNGYAVPERTPGDGKANAWSNVDDNFGCNFTSLRLARPSSCYPTPDLADGRFLVLAVTYRSTGKHPSWNSTVAGRGAIVMKASRPAAVGVCPSGATSSAYVVIQGNRNATVQLEACFGRDTGSTQRTFTQVLRSATRG